MAKDNYLKNLFYKTLRIRNIELEISKRYSEQKMRCPVHLSIGQESIPVSICASLKKDDEIVRICKKNNVPVLQLSLIHI